MRVLLDECLPARLRFELAGHEVSTVAHLGWSGIKNGALLRGAVEKGFDVFVTADRQLSHQHRLAEFDPAVVVLRCASNDIDSLRQLLPELQAKLSSAPRRAVTTVGRD